MPNILCPCCVSTDKFTAPHGCSMAEFSFFFPSLHFLFPKSLSLNSGRVSHTLLDFCAASDAFFPPRRRKGGAKNWHLQSFCVPVHICCPSALPELNLCLIKCVTVTKPHTVTGWRKALTLPCCPKGSFLW